MSSEEEGSRDPSLPLCFSFKRAGTNYENLLLLRDEKMAG
jgi:hypothetical protein